MLSTEHGGLGGHGPRNSNCKGSGVRQILDYEAG